MIPVLTPTEMAAVDAAAPEPIDVLVGRAAAAVARAATEELGGTYGRRVVVVAGPGNNGEDGRVAAGLLARSGVKVSVIDALDPPPRLPDTDLVIDAAFGTGMRGEYRFPATSSPVLAVDIPSGVDGLTGQLRGEPAHAVRTVCFAALKPGLVLGDGPAHAGMVEVVDIGLDVSSATMHLCEPSDPLMWVPDRRTEDHKWRHAVRVVAGSAGMSGSAYLAAAAAMRGGSGYVRLSTPGVDDVPAPVEVVVTDLPATGWAAEVLRDLERFSAAAIGPGLGQHAATATEVRECVAGASLIPTVIDGDGLRAFGPDHHELLRSRSVPAVLTPHDAEFAAIAGTAVGPDRVASCRELAAQTGAVVLLKGPTTVVSDPDGEVVLVRAGDRRLATAGTGDVLCGLVAAALASGAAPLLAAAGAAQLHGDAALSAPARGMVASDLLDTIPAALDPDWV